MRSDTERNRKRLVSAAAYLYAHTDGPVNMSDVAKRAEVSTATAYRHFNSVEDILARFRYEVGLRLRDFSLKQDSHGLELLEAVSRRWISLVIRHGGAMVHTRSGEGYLARLRQGAVYLTVQAEALQIPLSEAAAELGIPDCGDEAMFLWNILFDPREIFDLLNTVGLTEEQAGTRLVSTLCGALKGWTSAAASPGVPGTSDSARP